MRNNLLIPLVGSHFRPPASLVLASLPAGTELRLVPEPTNPYDPGAVQVWVSPASIPDSQYAGLEESLPASGHDLSELLAGPDLMLGYLCAATNGKQLGKAPAGEVWVSNADLPEGASEGVLVFSSTGQALVSVSEGSE